MGEGELSLLMEDKPLVLVRDGLGDWDSVNL